MKNKVDIYPNFYNEEKSMTALELSEEALEAKDEEKNEIAIKLAIAVKELSFLIEEKDKHAAELVIANKELALQIEQKDNLAAELVSVNKELALQIQEKTKREEELVFANNELIFQEGEKKKRAVELINSNKEVDELEMRVKERTQDLEAFSYSVSHDLRTPLRAINGYAQMLIEDYDNVLDTEGKRLLGQVRSNAKKMGVLIDDLLTFSRLGRKGIIKSPVNMNKIVETALGEINQSQMHTAEIRFINLLPVIADYNLLKHVIINLLSNAIKYSSKKEDPFIEISSELKNGTIIYSISDNGAGFDMQYVNKLFGVFQRLHSAEEFSGTGVGLAIVKRIIHKHDGKVWAQGKEGEGATFFFSLPAIEEKKQKTNSLNLSNYGL